MPNALSIYLDLVRLIAALVVFGVHANYSRFSGGLGLLPQDTNLGNDAVMVFFVLSGFVIAYVADAKEATWRDFSLSRLARLYSVAIPALCLTVLLDYAGTRIDYHAYYGDGSSFRTDNPLWRIGANLFFINELWLSSVRPFSDGPFWSLGYEFWYYAIFAVFRYGSDRFRWPGIAGLCLLVGPKILLLFPVWLMGVIAYHAIKRHEISVRSGWLLLSASVIGYALCRCCSVSELLLEFTIGQLGHEFVHGKLMWSKYFLGSYIVGLLIAIHFIGFSAIAGHLQSGLCHFRGPVAYLAQYTFAIYLFHYPMLQFFSVLASKTVEPPRQIWAILICTMGLIWLLGSVTERKKPMLKNALERLCDAFTMRLAISRSSAP